MPLTDRVKPCLRRSRGLVDVHGPNGLTAYDSTSGTALSVTESNESLEFYLMGIDDGIKASLTRYQVAQLAKALTTWLVEDNRRQREQITQSLE